MSRGLAEARRERTGGNDRADAGHHDRDGSEHLATELAEAGGGRESSMSAPGDASI